MSDVVRNYTWGNNLRKRRRDLRHRGTGIAKFMIPVLLLLLIWGVWATRNNYDRTDFIPRDAAVELYACDIVAKHAKVAQSALGNLIPESTEARQYWEQITGELPAPEWLINNMSADVCHVYTTTSEHMENIVVTTQMTRIGRVAEWILRLYSGMEKDFAGGLQLYHVPDSSLYYAVRGRVLIASLSRSRLIRALTLPEDETLNPDVYAENIRKAKQTDVLVCMQSTVADITIPFSSMEIALRLKPDTVLMSFQGNLEQEFMSRYAPFLKELTPQKLPEPFDCMATASVNFGMPLREVIEELRGVHPMLENIAIYLESDQDTESTLAPVADVMTLFKEALCITGTKTRIAWVGMNPYEMFPTPSLAASFNADTDTVLALFERITPSSEVKSEVDLTLRLDEEMLLAYSPVVGGNSIEPAVASYGNGILISASATLARELTKSPQLLQSHEKQGNLFLSVEPHPVVVAYVDAAREFAISGLLRGYDQASFEEAAQPFLDIASQVDSLTLFSACNQGAIQVNMKMEIGARRDSPDTASPESGDANE